MRGRGGKVYLVYFRGNWASILTRVARSAVIGAERGGWQALFVVEARLAVSLGQRPKRQSRADASLVPWMNVADRAGAAIAEISEVKGRRHAGIRDREPPVPNPPRCRRYVSAADAPGVTLVFTSET